LNYLLDTNIASYILRRRPSVVARVREVGGLELLSISTIALAELTFGIRIMPEGRRKITLLDGLDQMLRTGMDVRPFSAEAAGAFSEAGATLRQAGVAFSFKDLAIASSLLPRTRRSLPTTSFSTMCSEYAG
jgi:predicted nucleic acid-binding protein